MQRLELQRLLLDFRLRRMVCPDDDATGTGTFSYPLVARRLSDPQGCSSLGDPEVWSFTVLR